MKTTISIMRELMAYLKGGFSISSYTKYGMAIASIILVLAFNSCTKENELITDAIYVANEDDGTISIINTLKGGVSTIDLMENSEMYMPHNVQVAPNGNTIWVTAMPMSGTVDDQVIIIDPRTNEVTKRIKVGIDQHLAHVVFDNESNFAYVTAKESNQVIKISVSSQEEIARFDLGANHEPHGMRYHNGKLYVANMAAKSLSIIDVGTSVIEEIPLGGIAVQVAVLPDSSYVFVSLYDTKEVAKVNIQTKVVTKISLPTGAKGPIQLYSTPNSQLLYVCDQGGIGSDPTSNKVFVIDVVTNSVTSTITVGNKTHGVVVNNTGTKAYVTNSNDNTVSVIDIATQTVIETIMVGNGPNGISCKHHTQDNSCEGMP